MKLSFKWNKLKEGSNCDLVDKAEDSWLRDYGFKPPTAEFHHYFVPNAKWAKWDNGMFQRTWHCCVCCNPANGRADFGDGWLIISSFITKDEPTKVKQKNETQR